MKMPFSFTHRPLWSLSLVILLITGEIANAAEQTRPNVILIFADDLGYGDLASYGHPYAKTPSLDKLASQGTQFMKFNVTGVTCHPSRCGLLTSRTPESYPLKTVTYGFSQAQFGHKDRPTIMEVLKEEAGYHTGLIGKWHLGSKAPAEPGTYGLDEVEILGGGAKSEFGRDQNIFERAMAFIERNHDQGPFYLNVMARITHHPVDPRQDLVERAGFDDLVVDREDFRGEQLLDTFDRIEAAQAGDQSIHSSMQKYLTEVFFLDRFVGQLVDRVDELGIGDHTIIMFSSDQGPAVMKDVPGEDQRTHLTGWSGGLRGQKKSQHEGGVRSPCIIRWPGKVPAGKINTESTFSGLDWMPTLLGINGIPTEPYDLQGEDVQDIWLGSDRSRKAPQCWASSMKYLDSEGEWRIYFESPSGNEVSGLYNLETDLGETRNLLENPEYASKVRELQTYWKETWIPERDADKNKS